MIDRGDSEADESIALIDGGVYDSIKDAEAAGLAWAGSHGVERLFVSTDA